MPSCALLDGQLTLAATTEILLEYEEVTTKLSGPERWRDVSTLLDLLGQLHGNILQVEARYRFNVIAADPDDNKFCDCAIAAAADFVLTDDAHFIALKSAGYKPQPIAPKEFIERYLASA